MKMVLPSRDPSLPSTSHMCSGLWAVSESLASLCLETLGSSEIHRLASLQRCSSSGRWGSSRCTAEDGKRNFNIRNSSSLDDYHVHTQPYTDINVLFLVCKSVAYCRCVFERRRITHVLGLHPSKWGVEIYFFSGSIQCLRIIWVEARSVQWFSLYKIIIYVKCMYVNVISIYFESIIPKSSFKKFNLN